MAQFQDSGQSITKDLMKRKERYKLTKEKEEDMICEKIIDTKKQKTDDNKTFPRCLSQDVTEFTKITMDAYRDGSIQGEIKVARKNGMRDPTQTCRCKKTVMIKHIQELY